MDLINVGKIEVVKTEQTALMKELMDNIFQDHIVRTILDDNNEIWFVAKDICNVLTISKYRDAVSRLDDDQHMPLTVDTLGGAQKMSLINEIGLYSLIIRSQKPQAKAFKKWITSELLPKLRKGELDVPRTYVEALRALADKTEMVEKAERMRIEAEEINLINKPKVLGFNSILEHNQYMNLSNFAKMICSDLDMKQKDVFNWLETNKYIFKRKIWHPYQKRCDDKLMRLILVDGRDGCKHMQCMITSKGVHYISQKIISEIQNKITLF